MASRSIGKAPAGAVLGAALLLTAAVGYSQAADKTTPVSPSPATPPGAVTAVVAAPGAEILDRNHKLAPGDVIDVINEGFPEYSRLNVTLFEDGTFEMKVLGVVSAKGLTTSQLKDVITEGLKSEFKHPHVAVELRHIYIPPKVVVEPKHIYVEAIGAVQHPGSVELTHPPMRLHEVLTLIGWRADADLRFVHVQYPADPTRPEQISNFSKFGVSEDTISPKEDIEIFGNERIILLQKPEAPKPDPTRYQVLGYVTNPGPLESEKSITLAEALAKAGGPLPGAELGAVTITHVPEKGSNTKPGTMTASVEKYRLGDTSQNPVIESGDVIRVSQKAMKVYVYGEVNHKGDLAVRRDATVLQVWIEAGVTAGSSDDRVQLIKEVPGVVSGAKVTRTGPNTVSVSSAVYHAGGVEIYQIDAATVEIPKSSSATSYLFAELTPASDDGLTPSTYKFAVKSEDVPPSPECVLLATLTTKADGIDKITLGLHRDNYKNDFSSRTIDVRDIQKKKIPDVKMAQRDVLFVPHKGIKKNFVYYLSAVASPLWLTRSISPTGGL